MKDSKYIYDFINENEFFSASSFSSVVREADMSKTERDAFRILAKLKEDGIISRTGRNQYSSRSRRIVYKYPASEQLNDIECQLSKAFPYLDFQTWELYQLNEFVNHLLAHNIVFVEVEHGFEPDMFEFLRNEYKDILLAPDEETLFRYRTDDMVVVQRLVSGSPCSKDDPHKIGLEKLLVDLFSKSITGKLIAKSEYRRIYEDSFMKYLINERGMFRYAGRRNLKTVIRNFINNETDIKLVTEII